MFLVLIRGPSADFVHSYWAYQGFVIYDDMFYIHGEEEFIDKFGYNNQLPYDDDYYETDSDVDDIDETDSVVTDYLSDELSE